jgi:hypothetical protein
MKKKCPHCKSTKLEYLPDVDNASFISHKYIQDADGNWKIKVTFDKYINGKLIENLDASTIKDGDIWQNDTMPYLSCLGCTAGGRTTVENER